MRSRTWCRPPISSIMFAPSSAITERLVSRSGPVSTVGARALFGTIERCGRNFYGTSRIALPGTSNLRCASSSLWPRATRFRAAGIPVPCPRCEAMARMIDQIRASKLPSNMMQFAARGALQVPAAENIEILVYLARHNHVFGDTARMTLAGWDNKACLDAVSDPQTPAEVLNYFISPDNVRPKLLAALLENPSVHEPQLVKLAGSALRETLEIMLQSQRVRATHAVLEALHASPYLKKEESEELERWLHAAEPPAHYAAQESHEEHASA